MENVGDYEYSTKDLIGHGAFAVVFKGRHKTKPEHTVAIKSITKKNLAKSQNLLGKEIKILKELTELQHDNVVALLDCKETQNHVFLVMEYCNGGDLADYLHAKGTLSEDTIRHFLRQIAGAMRALNGKGVVHRDLKPQNILLCNRSPNPSPLDIVLKIADFGFARFLNEGVMAATLCGSPMYMAPEVIMSLQYDAKADLWSIGTIVFQCLTGKAPFHAQTPQALKQYYEKNPNLSPKIPSGTSKELTDLLLRLLKRNAKERMEFDDFFEHPFLRPQLTTTKPVPVPRSQTLTASPGPSPIGSPQSPAFYGSPVMAMQMTANSPKQVESNNTPQSSSDEQVDDFVVIPPSRTAARYIRGASNESLKASPGSSYASPEPMPVPTQRAAYNRIQKQQQGAKVGAEAPQQPNLNEAAKAPPKDIVGTAGDRSSVTSDGSTSSSRYVPDVAQLSPPSVQFVIGTPPRHPAASLLNSRRTSAPVLNFSGAGQTSPGSYHPHQVPPYVHGALTPVKPQQLFGTSVPATKHSPDLPTLRWSNPQLEQPMAVQQQLNANKSALPFGQSAPAQMPFMPQPCMHGHFPQQQFTPSNQYHMCCCQNAVATRAPFSSPSHMEEQMTFMAPELSEETLLDRDHNETLAKLNFVIALVDCIMELAQRTTQQSIVKSLAGARGSPLIVNESASREITNETCRKAEQLVLYLRCLQLISSGLQLSKQEIVENRLRPSNSVRKVLRTMKAKFHHCLNMCKSLDVSGVLSQEKKDLEGITADKLIYNHAIEMCQSAALEELFGNPEECFRGYQKAQILLHSLSQQSQCQEDKKLLNMYKEAVERRLYVLESQGIVYAYDNSSVAF